MSCSIGSLRISFVFFESSRCLLMRLMSVLIEINYMLQIIIMELDQNMESKQSVH